MKKWCFLSFLLFSILSVHVLAEDFLSVNLKTRRKVDKNAVMVSIQSTDKITKGGGAEVPTVEVPVWRLSPSFSLDFYVEETKTNQITNLKKADWQVAPGFGYGLRWNPRFLDNIRDSISANYLLSLDLFIRAFPSDEIAEQEGNDYFNIDILPTITLFDWVSIGYGIRLKRAQNPGLESYSTALFCFGIRKAI